jgi:hypothetical protein
MGLNWANRLKRRVFQARLRRHRSLAAQRNTPEGAVLDTDGMSNAKERKFSFETL